MGFPEPTFYGAVTVSDRGQIVIPAKARKDLNIAEGEKLLVLSSPFEGVILVKTSVLTDRMADMQAVFDRLLKDSQRQEEEPPEEEGGVK